VEALQSSSPQESGDTSLLLSAATAARQRAEAAAADLRASEETERRQQAETARRAREDEEWERRFGVRSAADPSSPRPAPAGDGIFRQSRHQIPFPTAQSLKVSARDNDGIRNYFFRAKLMGDGSAFTFVGSEPLLQELMHSFGCKGGDPLDVPGDERAVVVVSEEGRVIVGHKRALLDVLRMASLRSWVRRDVIMCRSASFAWTEMSVVSFVLGIERGASVCHLAAAKLEAAIE
jgi:hypothetical protein